MSSYDEKLRSMREAPSTQEYREYPSNPNTFIAAMTDIPWNAPHIADISHYHNFMEVGACLEGNGTLEMEGRLWSYTKGALMLVPGGTYHATQVTEPPQGTEGAPVTHWRYIVVDTKRLLSVVPQSCASALKRALNGSWLNGLHLTRDCAEGEEAYGLFQSMFELKRHLGEDALPELEAMLLLMLTRLARCVTVLPHADVERAYIPSMLERTLQYVSQHYTEEIRISQLARYCAISESHFRRQFNLLVGYTPVEYIARFRVNRSMDLLRETLLSVSAVSMRSGFSSLSTFNRCFRLYTGETPTQWRRNHSERFKSMYRKHTKSTK